MGPFRAGPPPLQPMAPPATHWAAVLALTALATRGTAAAGSSRAFLVRGRQRLGSLAADGQPARCVPPGFTSCVGFGAACTSSNTCTTDKCYEGKCGMGPKCMPSGKACYKYSPHTCCTGECKGVTLRAECLRLLGLTDDAANHRGIAVDRQCENLGRCGWWPGKEPAVGPRITPWAVQAADLASKYYNLPGVTFATGAHVLVGQYIASREGQTHEGVAPDTTEPGTVRDGGTFFFTSDSYVATDIWDKYIEGTTTFCVAPILRGGVGGAFYAIGKGCCSEEDGFFCGDTQTNDAKACVQIAGERTRYNYAVMALDAKGVAKKFHGAGRGITTQRPIFCRWVRDHVGEQKPKLDVRDILYQFVVPEKTTYCVAPVVPVGGALPSPQQFWAVGTDCCSVDGGFHCGASEDAGAHSGKGDVDATGRFFKAVKMGELKYGWKTVEHPYFVHWTKEILVPSPGSGPRIDYKAGKGVVGVTNPR